MRNVTVPSGGAQMEPIKVWIFKTISMRASVGN